jgi:hypothetical protein
MKELSISQKRIAAMAGLLGSAIFVLTFTLEGLFRPGYDPLSTFVSALSLGPRGWIQITNFLIFGLLFFLFTRRIADEIRSGKASKGGLVLLTIIALCYFFSGPFVMDPTGTPLAQSTVHGTIHGILGAIVFMLMPISCFVYLRRFWIDPVWKSMKWWTLVLGVISSIGTILLTITSKSPHLAAQFNPWFGLIQRTSIVPFMVWIFVFALNFLRKDRQSLN